VIAFGSSITAPDVYARCARPGVELVAEPGSAVYPMQASGSLARTYNLILEHAGAREDLEALVLVHQDAEIVDPAFCAKARAVLEDLEVGVAGSVGATGVSLMGWWEGTVAPSSSVYRYGELGGGDFAAGSVNGGGARGATAAAATPVEVDTLYGVVLVLSPWAVRTLRFDEALHEKLGLDDDFCRQIRAKGRKVMTADLRVAHHHSLDLIGDPESWTNAHMRLAEKWDTGAGVSEDDWRARARRAEADAAAARLLVASRQLQADARGTKEQEGLRFYAHSGSWRLTEPLRRLNARRGGRAA
jgi:hypothetical protein